MLALLTQQKNSRQPLLVRDVMLTATLKQTTLFRFMDTLWEMLLQQQS